jgi:circadian clock protein KaiC
VQFLRRPESTRDERFLRILKLRGSDYIEGIHGFKITDSGLDIFPRLVSPQIPHSYKLGNSRVTTGVSGLDEIIGGGFWEGSTTLLAGPTGSGKTTLGLQFALAGARLKESTIYLNFQENPTQLARSIHGLGFDLDEAKQSGLELVYASPVELQIDSIIVKIFRLIEERKVKRVVIDSLGDLAGAASDLNRLHDYLYALTQHFTVQGITGLITYETAGNLLTGFTNNYGSRFSNMADNLILITAPQPPDFGRTLTCLKSRGSGHDLKAHTFEITSKGIVLS